MEAPYLSLKVEHASETDRYGIDIELFVAHTNMGPIFNWH